MMGKKKHYYARKAHRYLGLVLGVQFLFWTVGGLYFSWSDIDRVHGDHLRKPRRYLPASLDLASPQQVLRKLQDTAQMDSLYSLQLIEISGVPVYQIRYFAGGEGDRTQGAHGSTHHGNGNIRTQLANAQTGALLSPLSRAEAVSVAASSVAGPVSVENVAYLTELGPHHEYREKPLPAWAINFASPANVTVYVSAELGTFQSIRHNQWRVFDFLWMLHTMDYEGRDNFGNTLLQAFSVFGLFTVLSGFVLYYISSPSVRKLKKKISK